MPRDRSANGRAEICACTIIARNYLPAARVLATSFLAHNPGGRFFVLVLDDPMGEIDPAHEPFEVLGLADLDIERSDLDEMAAAYSVMEFATAVKPWLLHALFGRGFDQSSTSTRIFRYSTRWRTFPQGPRSMASCSHPMSRPRCHATAR